MNNISTSQETVISQLVRLEQELAWVQVGFEGQQKPCLQMQEELAQAQRGKTQQATVGTQAELPIDKLV